MAISAVPSVLRQNISAIPSPLKSLSTAEPLELEELELLLEELDELLELDEELPLLSGVQSAAFHAESDAQPTPGS